MTLGDADCCAKCGHGEIWHPNCCPVKPHGFIQPLVIDGNVLLVGGKFYFNFEGDRAFPNDPKGWIQCMFIKTEGTNGIVVKPKGFEKFIVSRADNKRFSLHHPTLDTEEQPPST